MGINSTYWTDDKPTKPGKYWFYKDGDQRIINVWTYSDNKDKRLFTNEDGGASLDDSMYDNSMWGNKPIPEPEKPGPPITT